MTDLITEQRNNIRQQVRHARKALSHEQQKAASSALLEQLKTHPHLLKAQRVSVTLAHDGEVDLTCLIEWCWQQQKQVYLPVVDPLTQGQLSFVIYQPDSEMTQNRYGIKEPVRAKDQSTKSLTTCLAQDLDIIFTPLVAFDSVGNRIGMGGGYYDRVLAPWFTEQTGPYPIGLAHDCQHLNSLPIQAWDVPLPEIITPQHHFHF